MRLKLLLFIVCFFSVARLCRGQTDGFTWEKVRSSLSYHPAWAVENPPVDNNIFNQRYTYLGKGAQSFVFASEDGQYVIKFFRHHHMRAPWIIRTLPYAWAKAQAEKRAAKVGKDFLSYKIAYESMPEETGLVYLHLNKTKDLFKKKVTFVDKIGIAHAINLDKMEFFVQKRATLLYPAIESLMDQEKPEEAKQAIAALVDLLHKRCQKGIFDKDPDLNTNFGYAEGRPIQIDVGRFKIDPQHASPEVYRQELVKITDNFHQWLMARYPMLDEFLKEKLREV